MTEGPVVCVGGLIILRGAVLLGRRSGHKSFAHHWDIPGGHVEVGEPLERALQREMLEELGITLTAWSFHSLHAHGPIHLHLYEIRGWRGDPTPRGDEHSILAWHRLADAARLPDLVHPKLASVLASLNAKSGTRKVARPWT